MGLGVNVNEANCRVFLYAQPDYEFARNPSLSARAA
jgi:hypothetical protein